MRKLIRAHHPWRALLTTGAVRATLLATTLAVLAPAVPAQAANREHLQIVADLRMLQEQTQQMQATIVALNETLKALNTRLDDQSNTQRKAFADQKLLVDTLAGEVRIVREKIDDTNVRLSSLSQEVDSLRSPQSSPPMAPQPPSGGAEGAAPPSAGGAEPATGGQPGGAPPAGMSSSANASASGGMAAPIGMSPTRLFEIAQADYAGGQWAIAINGFETYLKTFPKTDKADDAQFYIGEAYSLDGKFKEAVAAYDKVINDYPSGDRVPDALYKRGLAYSRLGQNDKARESFEAVMKTYPNSEGSRLAKQVLDRLARGSKEQNDE
jgi:tol-pal system protein YbgF